MHRPWTMSDKGWLSGNQLYNSMMTNCYWSTWSKNIKRTKWQHFHSGMNIENVGWKCPLFSLGHSEVKNNNTISIIIVNNPQGVIVVVNPFRVKNYTLRPRDTDRDNERRALLGSCSKFERKLIESQQMMEVRGKVCFGKCETIIIWRVITISLHVASLWHITS